MRKPLLTSLLIYFTILLHGQAPLFVWAKQVESGQYSRSNDMVLDAAGNIYQIGSFNGTADFDPGPGVYNLSQPSGNGMYISKLDANGNFIWAKQFVTWNGVGYSITLDGAGNIYTTGFFQQIADFDPGPGVYNLTNVLGSDVFVSKLDNNGDFVWAKQFGGINNIYLQGYDIKVDASGNVYTTGHFEGVADFDPGPGIFNMTPTRYEDVFVTKLDVNGNLLWAKQAGGLLYDSGQSLTLDPTGNVLVTGYFSGTVDFDPGAGVFNMNTSSSDIFILKLDPSGNFIWGKKTEGTGGDIPRSIETDPSGNIYLTGYYRLTCDFDPGAGIYNLTSAGSIDIFLLKLDASGNFAWAQGMGGPEYDRGHGICFDMAGNVYLTGDFQSNVDFDSGPGVLNCTSNGNSDIYILKLDGSGNFIWVRSFGGSDEDISFSIKTNGSGDIFTNGLFKNTADFDPGASVFNLTSTNVQNAFVQKLGKCTNISYDTLTTNACRSYILNNQTYASSGIYTQVLQNISGCDSIVTLILTIKGSNDTTSFSGCNSYTWNGTTYTTSGFYRDTLTDVDGCDSILNLDLRINYSVTTTIIKTICEGENYDGYTSSGTHVNNFVGVNGCDSVRTIHLTILARSYSTLNAVICQGENFLSYTLTGTYRDTLVAANGCDSIRTINLVVNPMRIKNLIASICEGEIYYAGGTGQTLTGTYSDTLQTYLGCDSIVITQLIVNPKPLPNLGVDRGLCVGETITFHPGVFTSYEWQNQTTFPNFTTGITGLYWVTVTDNNGCRGSDSAEIKNIFSNPVNFLRQTDSICQYEKLTIETFNSYKTYSWSTGSTSFKTVIDKPGLYTLSVIDKNDCKGKDTIQIIQKSCLTGVKIPTGFTPNGDQLNDVFRAKVYGISESFLFRVYDRWGNMVFSTSDPQKGWDGKVKGISVGTSVFVWQCSYKLQGEKPGFQKGTVILIK